MVTCIRCCCCCSVTKVMSDSLQPHGLQHSRLPCPSLSLRACSHSCLLSQWCYLTILFMYITLSEKVWNAFYSTFLQTSLLKKNPLENCKLKLWCLKWEQWIKWSFRNPIILLYPWREVIVIVRRIWTVKPPAEGRIDVSYIPALSKGSAFPVSYSN